MKVVLIGTGNVATHLGKALQKAQHDIVQAFGRHKSSAKLLAEKLSCSYVTSFSKLEKNADFCIIAVKDEAIEEVAKQIPFADKIVLHTSGSVSIDVLKKRFKKCGVIYPVQTLTRNLPIDFIDIPVCVEGADAATEKKIFALAKSVSRNVIKLNSKKRKQVHLAAVFANNFTNHLYNISEKILKVENIPFDILHELIFETSAKALNYSPDSIQTGPAKRNDKKIIKEHLKLLSSQKDFKKIYKLLSESIQKNS